MPVGFERYVNETVAEDEFVLHPGSKNVYILKNKVELDHIGVTVLYIFADQWNASLEVKKMEGYLTLSQMN